MFSSEYLCKQENINTFIDGVDYLMLKCSLLENRILAWFIEYFLPHVQNWTTHSSILALPWWCRWASTVAQTIKNLPVMQGAWV